MTIEKVESPCSDRRAWLTEMVTDIPEMGFDIKPKKFWNGLVSRVATADGRDNYWQSVQATADMIWLTEEINRNVAALDSSIGFDPQTGLFEE